jgi:AraC-like DNA-binding protein
MDSLTFEIEWIREKQPWPEHGTHGWRSLPSLLVLVAIKGHYDCKLENGVHFRTGPHEALVLPAGVPHQIQFPHPGVLVGAHLNYQVLGGIDLLRFFDVPHRFIKPAGKLIGNLLQKIARGRQTASYGIPSAVREKALGFELLSLILQHASSRRIDVARIMQLQRLSRVLEFIQEQIDQPITIGDLCRQARLSRQRFHAVFKEASGFSPKDYLSRAKIQKAKQLLISKELSIGNIADQLGYCNPYHFSTQFKLHSGVSPSVYRRRIFEYEN